MIHGDIHGVCAHLHQWWGVGIWLEAVDMRAQQELDKQSEHVNLSLLECILVTLLEGTVL